jgi:hypothetical protein
MKTATLRFTTVRTPAPPTAAALAIPFNSSTLTTDKSYQGSLLKRLNAISENEKLTGTQIRKEIEKAVAAFRSSDSMISTDAQFETEYPGFSNFREWVTSSSKVSIASVYQKAEKILGFSKQQSLPPEKVMTLIDSLIAHVVLNDDPRLREKISSALRIDNIVKKAGNRAIVRGAADLRKLIGAPVILPEVVALPVSAPHAEPDNPTENKPSIEQRKRDVAKLNSLATAHTELLRVRDIPIPSEIEQAKSLPDPKSKNEKRKKGQAAPPTAQPQQSRAGVFKLHKEHFDALSSDSRETLRQLHITGETSFSNALARIEEAGKGAALGISKGLSPYKQYVMIGTSLVPKEQLLAIGSATLASTVNQTCSFDFPRKIADLRIIEQELKDYLAGEVAHVENILQGEMKERSTRRLRRTEDTVYTSSEREETTERDTQTTDRFSLEKEISKTVKSDMEMEINGKVQAEYYGPVIVKAEVAAGYSTSNSSEQSTKEAVRYAKDIVERSSQKIIERVKEERTVKTIEEFEENNRHGLNNVGGQHHVVGVYRWLNKEYTVWLKNYGKRLMFELMIPRPAAYHLFAITQKNDEPGIDLQEPLPPSDAEFAEAQGIPGLALSSHHGVDAMNYALWAAAYGADVTPPPATTQVVTGALSLEYREGGHNVVSGTINIPSGYVASRAFVFGERATGGWGNAQVGLTHTWGDHPNWALILNNEILTLPIHLVGAQGFLIFHIDVECTVTPQFREEWQIKTYKAILSAYEAKKAAYATAVAEAKANAGVVIRGTNPLFNKTVIETELKKNAIRLMTHCNPLLSEAMRPEGDFNCCDVMREGPYIKFVEQVFEWRNMVYEFYPYHWAQKNDWPALYNITDTDPLFQNFLKAGYARVLVPVTPGFVNAALNFVSLGTPDLNDLAMMPVMDVIDGLDEDIPTLSAARVSTQTAIDLSAPGAVIDGVTMVAGDRVLVREQDPPADNGVYVWNGDATPMTRATDAATPFELNQALIEVKAGSDTGFTFRQTEDVDVVGTDPVVFKIGAYVINESLLIPTDLTILECKSAGVEPTSMKILGLCETAGVMTGGTTPDDGDDEHEHE